MTYCTLEEAWNNTDSEDNELEYNNYHPVDNNYFDFPSKNKKQLDFNNQENEITRNNHNNNKINRMEKNDLNNNLNNNLINNFQKETSIVPFSNSNSNSYSNFESLYEDNEDNEDNVESETQENETFQEKEYFTSEKNKVSNTQIDNIDLKIHEKLLINIMERLDNIDKKLSTKKEERNNVHDIILFIVIGIFILFALDSIFRIGRMTI